MTTLRYLNCTKYTRFVPKVHEYYVYILSDQDGSHLYTGVTSALGKRLKQHATGANEGYTCSTEATILRFYEKHNYIHNAILREKQIKGLSREKKLALIESVKSGVEGSFSTIPNRRSQLKA